jgi:glycosyltransferase involved in cell wall biosynthesis
MTRIAFSWNGLPQYAARLIRKAVDRLGEDCVVIGSRPTVPIEGMEEVLSCPILWVDSARPARWSDLGLEVPEIFVQSGWGYPAFNSLGAEVKARGGRVIGLSDNNWRGDFRQMLIGAIAFRFLHRRRFDAMIVPGRQGQKLMRWFGMPKDRVRGGMYGADPALFNGGDSLSSRPKTFFFVGQFIARKDVLGLANAFIRFVRSRPGWTLRLCGSGVQRSSIPEHENIVVEDFVQPEQLVERLRQAQFLVLPSLSEAWGLVVHEAASCGCGLVLSNRIGSADDLSTVVNSVCFTAGSEGDLLRALHEAADFDGARLLAAEKESRRLAGAFGPDRFSREVEALIRGFSQEAAKRGQCAN